MLEILKEIANLSNERTEWRVAFISGHKKSALALRHVQHEREHGAQANV